MADHPIALTVPRLEVLLSDGRLLAVQALNPDLLRYDRTAAKHGWPEPTKAPFLWLTFLAWSALTRTGAIEDVEWQTFADEMCLQVRNLGEEDEAASTNGTAPTDGVDAVDPTPQEVAPG